MLSLANVVLQRQCTHKAQIFPLVHMQKSWVWQQQDKTFCEHLIVQFTQETKTILYHNIFSFIYFTSHGHLTKCMCTTSIYRHLKHWNIYWIFKASKLCRCLYCNSVIMSTHVTFRKMDCWLISSCTAVLKGKILNLSWYPYIHYYSCTELSYFVKWLLQVAIWFCDC